MARMRRAIVLSLLIGLAAAAPAPAATFRSCTQVNFTPQSDDVAASIRVSRVTCRYARRFIRETEGRPGATVRGWTCTRRQFDDGLFHTKYRCTRGARVMRWSRY